MPKTAADVTRSAKFYSLSLSFAVRLSKGSKWWAPRLASLTTLCAGLLSGLSCARDPAALTAGATWLTSDAPLALRPHLAHYEQRQFFGMERDPHAWRATTRYTLRTDAAVPNAGCSFVEWIPGTWIVKGSTLIVLTPEANSGSLEMHDCPGSDDVKTMPRPAHFLRAESDFTLKGKVLHLSRQFGENPVYPVDLTRQN